MKKRTIFNYLILLFSVAICITSCEKDNETIPDEIPEEEKNDTASSIKVPEKIGVIPPKSLNAQMPGVFNKSTETESEAYVILTEEIDFVRHYMNDVQIEMMMIGAIMDDILKETDGKSGSVPANTLKVTYTQEMEDKIDSLYPGMNISLAGKVEDVPALELTIDSVDIDDDGYMYQIVYDKSSSLPNQETSEYSMTVKWSLDNNKVFIKRHKTLTLEIPPSPVVSISSVTSIYDAFDNEMALNITDKTTQDLDPKYSFDAFKVVMKETGNGNNEIYYDSRSFHVDEITEVVINNKIARADDNGGTVKMDLHNWSGAVSYKETFDASGTILIQSSSEDGIVWEGDEIPDDFSTYTLSSPNLSISGFTPDTNKKYCFVIVKEDAPLHDSDPVGFLSSIIGFVVYEKSENTNAVTDSHSWESINSVQVYEFDNDYTESNYAITEYQN